MIFDNIRRHKIRIILEDDQWWKLVGNFLFANKNPNFQSC